MTEAILAYLSGVSQYITTKVSKLEFGNTVQALCDVKLEPDKTLVAETTRHWNEIALANPSSDIQFDRSQQEVDALLTLTLQDVMDFWKDSLYASGKKRMLITQVVPQTEKTRPSKKEGKDDDDVLVIGTKDISKFRQQRMNNN